LLCLDVEEECGNEFIGVQRVAVGAVSAGEENVNVILLPPADDLYFLTALCPVC